MTMTYAALGLGLILAGSIHLTTSRSCDVPLHSYNLTALHPRLSYLEPDEVQGWQVILPDLYFPYVGYVTGWEGHALAVTTKSLIDNLPLVITFQVWRPDPSGEGFTLVDSNELSFSGLGIRDNITTIPERADIGYFSFEESLQIEKQIHFQAGDVVGWFIPARRNILPLSVLFLNDSTAPPGDEEEERVDMYVLARTLKPCAVCSSEVSDAVVITSVLPLMSVKYATYTRQETCEPQICETSMLSEATPTMSVTTPTSVTRSTRQTGREESAIIWLDNRATSTILLFTFAAVVGILVIQLIFCGYGIIKLKQLNKLLSNNPSRGHKGRSCNHGLQSCDSKVQSCDSKVQSCDHLVQPCERREEVSDQYCDAEVVEKPHRPCRVERKNSYLVTPPYCLESEIL